MPPPRALDWSGRRPPLFACVADQAGTGAASLLAGPLPTALIRREMRGTTRHP
jgi:hypothetical protein